MCFKACVEERASLFFELLSLLEHYCIGALLRCVYAVSDVHARTIFIQVSTLKRVCRRGVCCLLLCFHLLSVEEGVRAVPRYFRYRMLHMERGAAVANWTSLDIRLAIRMLCICSGLPQSHRTLPRTPRT